jgi:hypothetical protein
MVGVAVATDATVGVAVALLGVAVALLGVAVALVGVVVTATVAPGVAVAAGAGVPMHPMRGGVRPGGHGGSVGGAAAAGAALHVDVMILLVSSCTAALLANVRPSTNVPVFTVIDVRAKIVPRKVEPVSSVAELPTCQKTLHGLAPLMRFTELPVAVMSVEGAWKIQTEFGLLAPSSVRGPVKSVGRLDRG